MSLLDVRVGGSDPADGRVISLHRLVTWSMGLFLAGFFFVADGQKHNLIFYVTAAIGIFTFCRTDFLAFWRSPVARAFLVYALLFASSTLIAVSRGDGGGWEYVKYCIHLFVFLFIFSRLVACNRFPIATMQNLLVCAGTLGALAAIAMFMAGHGHSHEGLLRLVGLGRLDHPNVFASTMALTVVLAVDLSARSNDQGRRLLWLACAGVMMVAGLLTQSRTGFLALLVGGSVWALWRGGWVRRLWLTVVLIAVAAVGIANLTTDETPRLLSLSASVRTEIWLETIKQIMNFPVFGHGAGSEWRVTLASGLQYHPHNFVLASLLHVGVVGTLPLLFAILLAFRATLRNPDGVLTATALAVGVVCLSTESYHLVYHPGPPYLFFWLPVAWIIAADRPSSSAAEIEPASN